MEIDGKTNVKERIKLYENKNFITYLYIFENGNRYKESKTKWTQKDFGNNILLTPEEQIEQHLDELAYRR